MVKRGEITDQAWQQIEPLLPEYGQSGGQWRDHRTVVNGLLWKLRTGSPWRDPQRGETDRLGRPQAGQQHGLRTHPPARQPARTRPERVATWQTHKWPPGRCTSQGHDVQFSVRGRGASASFSALPSSLTAAPFLFPSHPARPSLGPGACMGSSHRRSCPKDLPWSWASTKLWANFG
jgi:Putative transposase of IS4/5 family (DUF4096)